MELLFAVINATFHTLFEDIYLFILHHSDDVLMNAKTWCTRYQYEIGNVYLTI